MENTPMTKLTAADGHEFTAFEAGDANAARGLVVVQEIFGVNAHMRLVSERLAGFGYHVLCPAFFDRAERDVQLGYTPEDVKKGLELRSKISQEATLLDIAAAAAKLGNKPVGIIGYCWGGTMAWVAASATKNFKASVGWYGGGIAAQRNLVPNCPVQLHFGEQDHGISMSDVAAIREAQPGVEVFTYAGAQHGFGCEARPSYSPRDCELAELRSLAFFAEHLR
jgi:carboxymethylenebutenolidase